MKEVPDFVLRECSRSFVEEHYGIGRAEQVFSKPSPKAPPKPGITSKRKSETPVFKLKKELEIAEAKVRNIKRRISNITAPAAAP